MINRGLTRWMSRVAVFAAAVSSISAGQFTLVEFFPTDLAGSLSAPPPVYGSVFGPATSTWSGSSTSNDGQYIQMYSGSGTASITTLRASASESVSCVLSSCTPYALPFSANAGSADYSPGISTLAWWNDIITVNPGPGFARLNFVFNVDGTFSQSGSGSASASLVGESCAATETLCTGGPPATPRHITNLPITHNGLVTLNLQPWLIGQPFDYEFILAVSAATMPTTVGSQGFIQGNSSASTDFSNTAQLIGVNPVDSNGNLVTGTTITSASGFALPGPTPEPSTFVLFLAGLVFVALWKKRRVTST
jgi:PEP-CTERM motif